MAGIMAWIFNRPNTTNWKNSYVPVPIRNEDVDPIGPDPNYIVSGGVGHFAGITKKGLKYNYVPGKITFRYHKSVDVKNEKFGDCQRIV